MASFFAAFEDLFKSFYELLTAIISTIVHLFQSIISAILGFFASIFSLVGDVLGGVADVAGGVGKFVTGKSRCRPEHVLVLTRPGNIVILAIVAAGAFAFIRVQQGRPIVPSNAAAKKTN